MTEEMLSSIVGVESTRQPLSSIEYQLLPVTKQNENHLIDKMFLKKNTLSLEEYLPEFNTFVIVLLQSTNRLATRIKSSILREVLE